ncbi:HAD-IA family hydrolase [Litoribacter alkaliphilus]|uniref:HAD-IA family hydrolase n=1 Tax=Litoribacter ruber TaxID=702568 RepID=A0AAP2CM57_9BACT|nr:HAD-IA family hydrolase [Litoribacter alkaliphilus]MBS9525836.1 HAD-IA family hydrolase [Litoribacter alkaliphilus]
MSNDKAVIFDMDGVLVDSEGFWKQAENEVFSSLGVVLTEEYTNLTKSMTTTEVAEFWFEKYPWKQKTLKDVEEMVILRVIELIRTQSCENQGVKTFIEKLKPDPAIYHRAASSLNIEPRNCIAIEDSHTGMLAAKRAGMKVFAFTNGDLEINCELADCRINFFEENGFELVTRYL